MQTQIMNRMPWLSVAGRNPEVLLEREWLVTNGLGGYASGSVSGACTRRYHGLLIAALPAPLGRTVMFNHLAEEVRLPGGRMVALGGEESPNQTARLHGEAYLSEFRLEAGLPIWRYEIDGYALEKRVLLPYLQNTVFITYRLISGPGAVRLRLRPSLHFRPHDDSVGHALEKAYTVTGNSQQFEICKNDVPPLRMSLVAESYALVLDGGRLSEVFYRVEKSRGYDSIGQLWSPGYFRTNLAAGQEATLIGSTESWEIVHAITPAEAHTAERERRARLVELADPRARSGPGAELVLAADQFLIKPSTRVADAARAHAAGDEVRTVIAGYHWFTDWGRDTMISLEGLTLSTGRQVRRADPQLVPRRGARRAVSHGRRHALVFSCDRPLLKRHGRPPDAADFAADAAIDRRASFARHALRHRRRSGRRTAQAGRPGLSAHLDGRQGGRLGGHPAPRQGGGDQRPMVQLAEAAGGLAAQRAERRLARGRACRSCAAGPRIVQ